MSDIPRYRMTNDFGHQDNENGAWVRYEDHVAALKTARNELPDVGSWSPEIKRGEVMSDNTENANTKVSLEGRLMCCTYGGENIPSSADAPFFRRAEPIDKFYCGCNGWD